MKRKLLTAIFLLIILVAGYIAWEFFGPTVRHPEQKYFFVSTGETYDAMVDSLREKKIISSEGWFRRASNMIGYKTVRPGRYEIKKGMNLISLVRMLRNGQQSPVNFVITKLRTKEVLAARIGNAFECDSLHMIDFLNSPDSLREYGLDTNTVMVAAMPFTYEMKWNTTAGKIFQQFYTAYKTFWTPARKEKADSLHMTPEQVSTMASIIDEETNSSTDRPNIASVYRNRMAKGMPLQADPTVKFAMKNFSLRRIYQDYTRIQSPYNTYENKGLPPGPICTPAQQTIDAVLNSPATNYLYFVASTAFDGTHVFTTNYQDHMKYAKLYQDELNKRNVK
jgi:UPF0755 protein